MDKRKTKKTNKKKNKSQELSIGNLRKTELNCSQCQKQLFGLWKNESFQSCLECSGKKKNVLTMLKSMKRVCEVRLSNQIVDDTVNVRNLPDQSIEIEQTKDEENVNMDQYVGDLEHKNTSPDMKEETSTRRTRRSINLSNQSDQYEDDGKNNCVLNELVESVNDDKMIRGGVTENFENGATKTVSEPITRRRSSLVKSVLEDLPKSDVCVSPENIQEDNKSKKGRGSARISPPNDDKISEQHKSNKKRQHLPFEESSSVSKLTRGRKKGKQVEAKNDESSNTDKLSEYQREACVENNSSYNNDESTNTNENGRRRGTSNKESININEPITRRRSSLVKSVLEDLPKSDVYVSPENIQGDNKSKKGRGSARISPPNDDKISEQHKSNKKRQHLPFEESSSVSKLARGRKKGKQVEAKNDESSNTDKLSEYQREACVENNSSYNNDESTNTSEKGRRRGTSNEESININEPITRKRSSLVKSVLEDLPKSDVCVAPENIQEDNKSKKGRRSARISPPNDEKISEQHKSNKKIQHLPFEESSSVSKLARGRKKGKQVEAKNDESSNADKLSEYQHEACVENNSSYNNGESTNTNENGRRRRTSNKESININKNIRRRRSSASKISTESPKEEVHETRITRKSGKVHHHSKSPEDKTCDIKNEQKPHTDEIKRKQRSVVCNVEIKRIKIDMENSNISRIERAKRRSSNGSQNVSPNSTDNNKSLLTVQNTGSVDNGKKRTRVSLNGTSSESKSVAHTVLHDRVSNTSCGLEDCSEDGQENKQIKENKRGSRKVSETESLPAKSSPRNKGKRQGDSPINPKLKPLISEETLELLRTTKGMKPIVLVEKMITMKDKVAHQPTANKKTGEVVSRSKKRTEVNKNGDKSSDQSLVADNTKKTNKVSVKTENLVAKEDKVDSEEACDPKQKDMALRTLRKEAYNKSNVFKLNGNNARKSERQSKKQVIRKYRSVKVRNLKGKRKEKPSTVDTSTTSSKETKQKAKYFTCSKCKKQFGNAMQQKSHELMHRGYFELKLKRIDIDVINKTEGEMISKGIVNYILKSVFEQTDVHPYVPEERINLTTGTDKYKLRRVQVKLERVDLREGIAMNKYNEGVLIATSIVNSIVRNLDRNGEAVNIDSDNYSQMRKAESSISESGGSIHDEDQSMEGIQNTYLKRHEDAVVDDDTVSSDFEQTGSQTQKLEHSQYDLKEGDNSGVVNHSECEKETCESNDMLENADVNMSVEVHDNNLDENQSVGCHKNITNAQRMGHYSDRNLDTLSKFGNENEYPVSSIVSDMISDDGDGAQLNKSDTSIVSHTEFSENTYLRSRDSDMASAQPSACEIQKEGKYNGADGKDEIMVNMSLVTQSTEDDKYPDLSTKTDEDCDILLGTRSEKITCETNEVHNQSDKEETDCSKLQNVTSNEQVFRSDMTNNVNKTVSEKAENSDSDYNDDDGNDDDYDDKGGNNCKDDVYVDSDRASVESQQTGDEADTVESNEQVFRSDMTNDVNKTVSEKAENSDSDYNDEDGNDDDYDDKGGNNCKDDVYVDSDRASVESQQTADEADTVEISKRLSTSESDSTKSGESSANTSVDDTLVKVKGTIDVIVQSESPDNVGNSDTVNFKVKTTGDSTQEESSLSDQHGDISISDKDNADMSSEISSNIADNDEARDTDDDDDDDDDDADDEINDVTGNTDETNDYKVLQHDSKNYEPEDSEITDKSKGISFNKPCKQEAEDTLDPVCNKEISKSVSDNEIAHNLAFTDVSINYTLHKQDTKFIKSESQKEQLVAESSETTDGSDIIVTHNTDTITKHDSTEIECFSMSHDNSKHEIDLSKSRDKELSSFGETSSECIDIVRNKSYKLTGIKEDAKSLRTGYDDSGSQILMTEHDSKKTTLQNSSNNLVQMKSSGNGNSESENNRVTGSTLETDATSETNYKNVDKYLEFFIKDFIVQNAERSKSNIDDSFDSKQRKHDVTDETNKSDIGVPLTEPRHSGNITSGYVVSEKSSVNLTPTENASDFVVTDKSHLYNDSAHNMPEMLFGEVCPSSGVQRQSSQKLTGKESNFSNNSTMKDMNKGPIEGGCREGGNGYNRSTETGDSVYTRSDIKGDNLASSSTYVSDTTAMTNCRISGNDTTKLDTQGQFYSQNEMDFSATSNYSTGNMERQSSERTETAVSSGGNHVTYTIQKQSYDRREPDNQMDSTRRYSGEKWPTDSPSMGSSDSTRKYSNDKRELDYSTAGASNTYQRPVTDNRRQYMEPYENRGYVDPRDNRGNPYGPNWRHPVQNRTHPYQHNPHKRNDRGGYSNWRWPGQNNYSHYRHGNSWR